MFKRQYILYVYLVLIFIFQTLHGEVSLRVLLQPPMVTLECLITNPTEKASAIMMCPNDIMCFKGCSRICNKDCEQNNITCKEIDLSNSLKYTYTFDTTNLFNQGEWTCHFGTQQSSTVIFFNESKVNNIPKFTTATNIVLTKSKGNYTTLALLNNWTSRYYYQKTNKNKVQPFINPNYVIILLIAFVLSLCLNIILIVRSILYKYSTKSSNISKHLKEKSCFSKMCFKLFCVEKYFQIRNLQTSKFSHDDNPLLSRQTSNNIYECAGSSYLQPAILLDNCAYIGTPGNQRLLSQSMFSRSHSFPAKNIYQHINGQVGHNNVLTSPIVRPHFTQLISPQESVSQIIYDDVAEPSNNYMPSTYFASLNRQNKHMSLNGTFNNRLSQIAMSTNNLPFISQRFPEITTSTEDCNEEEILKDEISSRVELSKEMIIQADTLLKHASTLLYDNEQKKTNNNT